MKRADSMEKTLWLGKSEGKRRGQQIWLDGITNSVNMNLSKLWGIVKNQEVWRAAVHGVTKSQTWLHDWTTTATTKGGLEIKILQTKDKGKSWNQWKRNYTLPVAKTIQMAVDFSSEIMQAIRKLYKIFQLLKEKNSQNRILYPV